jgi:hypothetical protein
MPQASHRSGGQLSKALCEKLNMTTKSFAKELRDLVVSLKNDQGIKEISSENLISYLDEVLGGPEEVSQESLEKYKAELQVWVEQNKLSQSARLEAFKAVILQGQNALKTAFLMNGGATIAILAFLGKLTEEKAEYISSFSDPMVIFVIGVFLAGLSSGFTYLSQWIASHDKPWAEKVGYRINLLVILMGLSSFGFFIWGALCANRAFSTIA